MTATDQPQPARQGRPVATRLALALVVAGGLALLVNWGIHRANHVSTDDARVAADMIDIRSKTAGLIRELPVSQGQALERNAVIAQLDDHEVRLHLQELTARVAAKEANIKRAEAQMRMVREQTSSSIQAVASKLQAAEARLEAAEAEKEFESGEWTRAQSLRERKILSEREWENARNAQRHAEQLLQQARAEVAQNQADLTEITASKQRLQLLEQDIISAQHERHSLALSVEQAQVNLQDHQIKAPVPGIVDKVFVDAGEYIQAGQRVLLMHNPNSISINANIKETQIRHVKIGLPVDIKVDAYPDLVFAGTVEKIGDAATSQFSLLPSTNPSGNFTKVTQRIAVKIAVEQRDNLLKPGMMAEVEIDVSGG